MNRKQAVNSCEFQHEKWTGNTVNLIYFTLIFKIGLAKTEWLSLQVVVCGLNGLWFIFQAIFCFISSTHYYHPYHISCVRLYIFSRVYSSTMHSNSATSITTEITWQSLSYQTDMGEQSWNPAALHKLLCQVLALTCFEPRILQLLQLAGLPWDSADEFFMQVHPQTWYIYGPGILWSSFWW